MGTGTRLEKYKTLLANLLPKGKLWTPREQPNFQLILDALAVELCRVEERGADLLKEADPRVTTEMITDWERLLGLPDECTPEGLSLSERQQQILQKWTNVGGLNKTFYEFIGQQLGFEIFVTDFKEFRAATGAGVLPARGASAGDHLSNFFKNIFEAGDDAGDQLTVCGWRFYFEVNMPIEAAEIFEAGDFAGDFLREFSNPLIECTMRKLKPAHSAVFFTFRE